MKHEQFQALATLAGVNPGTLSREACYSHLVDGRTVAEAARLAGISTQTAWNAKRKLQLKAEQLPAILATVRAALGETA